MEVNKVFLKTTDLVHLVGLVHNPDENTYENIVISTHGMGSNCFKERDDVIAKYLTNNGFSYLTYNNRGSGLINTVRTDSGKILQGTVYEDVEESYYDVEAAINYAIEKGYKNIHLMGHSLGSTKTVFTYNRLVEEGKNEILEKIKSVLLLSLVDIKTTMAFMAMQSNFDVVSLALEKEKNGQLDYVINCGAAFLPMISVKTFLRYFRDNEKINFAQYSNEGYDFKELNRISCPIFMRWGNVKELIAMPADVLAQKMNNAIKNDKKDIGYVDGATHNYFEKEEVLAEEIYDFLKNV